ncbi:MAG: hypothetical protein A2Y33_03515 [Spirochaetes bacterium GWF1_51_8]|nr:MAG: hypothetical protein A2Y33_03515 [Spirochaetes bacterium GWF1_51_8]
MKRYLTFLTILCFIMTLSCGGPVDGSSVTVTNHYNVTNYTGISNFTDVVITNTPDQYIDVNLMNAVEGEWFVPLETFTDISNGMDANSNIIYIQFKNSNVYTSISNDGMDGAYSLKFLDGYVNKIIYNGQGTVYEIVTNLYKYTILSNAYGFRIDLEKPQFTEEIRYVVPVGPFKVLGYMTNEYIVKTNITENYRTTNVTVTTNLTSLVVKQTNDWEFHVEINKQIDSYTFDYSIQVIGAGTNQTNLVFGPDTNYYQLFIDANVKSSRQETIKYTYTYNGWGATSSPYDNFMLTPDYSYQLMKIK